MPKRQNPRTTLHDLRADLHKWNPLSGDLQKLSRDASPNRSLLSAPFPSPPGKSVSPAVRRLRVPHLEYYDALVRSCTCVFTCIRLCRIILLPIYTKLPKAGRTSITSSSDNITLRWHRRQHAVRGPTETLRFGGATRPDVQTSACFLSGECYGSAMFYSRQEWNRKVRSCSRL